MKTISKYAKKVGSVAMVLGMVMFASFVVMAIPAHAGADATFTPLVTLVTNYMQGVARPVARPCGGHIWAGVGHRRPLGRHVRWVRRRSGILLRSDDPSDHRDGIAVRVRGDGAAARRLVSRYGGD
jgi:monoamine oxidase